MVEINWKYTYNEIENPLPHFLKWEYVKRHYEWESEFKNLIESIPVRCDEVITNSKIIKKIIQTVFAFDSDLITNFSRYGDYSKKIFGTLTIPFLNLTIDETIDNVIILVSKNEQVGKMIIIDLDEKFTELDEWKYENFLMAYNYTRPTVDDKLFRIEERLTFYNKLLDDYKDNKDNMTNELFNNIEYLYDNLNGTHPNNYETFKKKNIEKYKQENNNNKYL
jgi:hypothetical protein